MDASLKLSWYKFKAGYWDFIKVLFGILLFEVLILFIQNDGFLEDFETSRMTLFLLLFSASLLILVQNSIYISKEYAILERDFFSGLNRLWYGLTSLVFGFIFALLETIFFLFSFQILLWFFEKDLPKHGSFFQNINFELFLTILLLFIAAHFIALVVSVISRESVISSIILSVVIGIAQFSLSGTILQLPKSVKKFSNMVFLGYGHKLFGMSAKIKKLPSILEKFHVPVNPSQLKQFKISDQLFVHHWLALLAHIVVYALLFIIILQFRRRKQ